VLRANTDGSTVRIKDVARVELGAQSYSGGARLDGAEAVGMGVQLTPTANALETSKLVKAKLDELQKFFPEGVKYAIPYDASVFISASIQKVVETLFEAVALCSS